MDKKTVFIKTAKGENEISNLSGDLRRAISLIDNKSTVDEISRRAPPSLREDLQEVLGELMAGGYIRDKNRAVLEPKLVTPKITPPKMFVPKSAASSSSDELDFTSMVSKPSSGARVMAKADEDALARAELEIAMAQSGVKSLPQDEASKETKLRDKVAAAERAHSSLEAGIDAAKARASAEAAVKAEARARQQAEIAAKAKVAAELKAKQEAANREQAEAKAKLEAAARARAEQEAARAKAAVDAVAKAKADADAKIRAEIEMAARAKQVAEAKAKAEAEARAKAEAEARAKAEAEARAKAEAEARAKAEAEARAKAEAEAEANAKPETGTESEDEVQAKLARKVAEATASRKAATSPQADKVEPVAKAPTSGFKLDLDKFSDDIAPAEPPKLAEMERDAEAKAKIQEKAQEQIKAEAKKDMAAEMARLKAVADAARLKAEEEALRLAEERALAEEQAKAWAEAEQRAQAQAKIEAEQAAQQAALSQAKAAKKSAPRARRAPLPLGKIAFSLILLALIAAVALPYVYPLQEYIAPLEQRLSAQLKQPVKIGGLSAASLPPKLKLQNVTVGRAQELKIGDAVLSFDLLSIFSASKAISDAELSDISVKGDLIARLAPDLQNVGADKEFPVRHFTLQHVKFVTDELALPDLFGIAELDAQGAVTRVALHSEDDKLSFDLQSEQARWQLGFSLKERALPWVPDVIFSDLNAKGILGEDEVNFTEMDAHIYDGILLGSAKLNWRKGWQLQGRLEAKLFKLDKMFPKYGIEGEMYGEGSFSMSGAKFSRLGESPRMDASFTVKGGNINGIDMVETARLLSHEHMVGGRTRFEDMIGTVQVENHISHFRQLKIVSGMLSAEGSFDASSTGQLSGNFNAEIKMRGGNNALSLSGALGAPKLVAR